MAAIFVNIDKRERVFLNAAKSEALDQTVRANGNGVRP
jgi:hypothetical protein